MVKIGQLTIYRTRADGVRDGVNEQIVIISSCLPDSEAAESMLCNELALGGEGRWVVIRDHGQVRRYVEERLRKLISDELNVRARIQ